MAMSTGFFAAACTLCRLLSRPVTVVDRETNGAAVSQTLWWEGDVRTPHVFTVPTRLLAVRPEVAHRYARRLAATFHEER